MFNKKVTASVVFVLAAVLGAVLAPSSTVPTTLATGHGDIIVDRSDVGGALTPQVTIQFRVGSGGATTADAVTVKNLVVGLLATNPSTFKDYVKQSTAPTIRVWVYRNRRGVTGGKAYYFPTPQATGVNTIQIDLLDNERVAKHLKGFTDAQKNTIATTANKWTLAHEFGHMNGTPRDQAHGENRENPVLADINAGWLRVNYGDASTVPLRVGTQDGTLNSGAWSTASCNRWSGWSGVVEEVCEEPPDGVGGIAEPQEIGGDSQAEPADATDSNDRGGLAWVIVGALAGAGVAGIAGYGALRLRTRR